MVVRSNVIWFFNFYRYFNYPKYTFFIVFRTFHVTFNSSKGWYDTVLTFNLRIFWPLNLLQIHLSRLRTRIFLLFIRLTNYRIFGTNRELYSLVLHTHPRPINYIQPTTNIFLISFISFSETSLLSRSEDILVYYSLWPVDTPFFLSYSYRAYCIICIIDV